MFFNYELLIPNITKCTGKEKFTMHFNVNKDYLRNLDSYYTQSDWDCFGIDPETGENYPEAFKELQRSLSKARARRHHIRAKPSNSKANHNLQGPARINAKKKRKKRKK